MFDPADPPIDPLTWKPSPALSSLAKRRCDWAFNDALVDKCESPAEFFAVLIVSCYYQGLADGIKHMARKIRCAPETPSSSATPNDGERL